MNVLARLFGFKTPAPKRVRICVECGMPVAEHKTWCSILWGQQELEKAGRRGQKAEASR